MHSFIFRAFLKNIFFVFFFALIGCGGSYNAEKMFWHTQQEYSGVIKNASTAEEDVFDEMVHALKNVIKTYPTWNNAPNIQYRIAEMYIARNDFAKARNELKEIIINFPKNLNICSHALFVIGTLYEKEGNHKEAIKKYEDLIELYPSTFSGLQAPLYLAMYYQKNDKKSESVKAYHKAIRTYVNIIDMNPYSKRTAALQHLIAIAYSGLNDVNGLMMTLQRMADKYPKSEAALNALYRIALLYRKTLNQPEKSKMILTKISKEYPGSTLGKSAQFAMGSMSLVEGDIEQAKNVFEEIKNSYPDDVSMNASAQFEIARGYERSERWQEAYETYMLLEKEYPDTVEALRVPLMIAVHYYNNNERVKAQHAFENAIEGYRRRINTNPKKRNALYAQELIAEAFIVQNKWKKAVEELNLVAANYPGESLARSALFKIATLYELKLNNAKEAQNTYAQLVQKYPKSDFARAARKKIKTLKDK